MNQRYIGPLASATLNPIPVGSGMTIPGGEFRLFPGHDPGLPEAHPYTDTLIAEGWLTEEAVPS